jgi:hypothetical protein
VRLDEVGDVGGAEGGHDASCGDGYRQQQQHQQRVSATAIDPVSHSSPEQNPPGKSPPRPRTTPTAMNNSQSLGVRGGMQGWSRGGVSFR